LAFSHHRTGCQIDPAILPHRQNIHYLGPKTYKDLPAYIGWDVALLPFARNLNALQPLLKPRNISLQESLLSTSICDVVRPYGQLGIVRIADTVVEFVAAATAAMNENPDSSRWLHQVDGFAQTSWDRTWTRMMQLVASKISVRLEAQGSSINPQENGHVRITASELWVECTVNCVGDEYFDQIELNGHAKRADDLDLFCH